MKRRWMGLAFGVGMLALVACSDDGGGSGPGEQVDDQNNAPNNDQVEQGLTYHEDIAPIIEANCGSCHAQGGAAPFVLDSYEALAPMADASLAAMRAGTMPPWLPDRSCRTFRHERFLPEEDRQTFEAWIEGGKVEGDPSQAPGVAEGAQEVVSFEPTHMATAATPYTPTADAPDDYRCFILDTEFERDTYLTGSNVVPDAGALVHHVLVYAMNPAQLDALVAADAAEPGEGFTCFGAPFPSMGEGDNLEGAVTGGGFPVQLGAWVPGAVPAVMDPGVGIRIQAGSRIVMQVHYNMLGAPPTQDMTAFAMRLTEEEPQMLASTRPLLIRSLEIPAGEPEAVNTRLYRNYTSRPLQIASVAAHMHLLGSSYSATVVRGDGQRECLLDIPRWDFNWQQYYQLPADDLVQIAPGDGIELKCTFDNSPANQAVVNGEQIEPRDVTWGEGTLDEMCMIYITFLEPFEPRQAAPEEPCAGVGACVSQCRDEGGSTTDCLLGCDVPTSCKLCALRSLVPCGVRECIGPFGQLNAQGCLEDCITNTFILGGDTGACLADICAEPYAETTQCLDPILEGGRCDEILADSCGIEL